MKWVAALRSGEFKQTTGTLQNEDGYCCLGVLADLHIAEKGFEAMDIGFADHGEGIDKCNGFLAGGTPSKRTIKWAGLKNENGAFNGMVDGHHSALTELNDSAAWGFKRIATFIEKNWKKL